MLIAQAWIISAMVINLISIWTIGQKYWQVCILGVVVQLSVSVLALLWQGYANDRDSTMDKLHKKAFPDSWGSE